MTYIYSFRKHTLVILEKIEYVSEVEENAHMYKIIDAYGDSWIEKRPEDWYDMMYELNRTDDLINDIVDIIKKGL